MRHKVLGNAVHPSLGDGEIIAVNYFKNKLKIKFNENEIYWLNKNHVTSDLDLKFDFKFTEVDNNIIKTDQFKSRHLLEALRLGIVPIVYIKTFTFGLERELEDFKSWLDSSNGCISLIGRYGKGKSHLINYVWKEKLENNWIISKVEINNNDCSLSNPYSIFKEVIRNLRFYYDERLCDYEDFFRILWEYDEDLPDLPEWYLTPVIKYYRDLYQNFRLSEDTKKLLMKYLIGKKDPGGYPKINYTTGTSANIICNILCGLTYISKSLGFNGFLILMDEGENLYYQKSYQKNLSLNHLSGLIALADQKSELYREEIIRINNKYKGSITGLRYCGYKPNVKFAFLNESCGFNLKILVSLIKHDPTIRNYILLRELREITKKEIIDNILIHYNKAYRMNLEENVDEILIHSNDENIRIFIKKVISRLDYIRVNQINF